MANTTTNNNIEKITTKTGKEFNPKNYVREILAIKKNTLKLSISDQEELSNLIEFLFNQRLTNINENVMVAFNNSNRYNSLLQIKSGDKIYFIYSQVSENKLRTNLSK